MGTVIYVKRQRKSTDDLRAELKKPKITGTNVVSFPIMERKAKICEICGLPFFEETCPDCGPNPDTDRI